MEKADGEDWTIRPKVFPVIANENVSQVFRISVTLKEPVDPELLSRALEEILPEIRKFSV